MLKRILLLAFFMAMLAKAGHSQEDSYEHIMLDASSGMSVFQNSFTDNWKSSPGFHLSTRINYHLGNLEAGVRYTKYTADNPDIEPDFEDAAFSSYFIYVGWEYPFAITDRLTLAPGLRFGNNYMSFDDPMVYPPTSGWAEYPFDPHESEFAFELLARLEYTLGNSPWRLHTQFSYNRTLTYHPLPVGLLSLGISRSFSTPDWLKDFLR